MITENVIWQKSVIMTEKGFTPIRTKEKVTGTHIVSNIDFDFTERIYNI